MSKMSRSVKQEKNNVTYKKVKNFMNGTSYEINPLDTLKMVTASSIFGEPSYYRNGEFSERKTNDSVFSIDKCLSNYDVLLEEHEGKTTSTIMEDIIDAALDFDFKATLEWAATLRGNDFNMRLNPQVIMVRAAIHPNRKKFTEEYNGLFAEINKQVMSRLDEPSSQFMYWLYKHKTKQGIPTILKKTWASKYENASKYQLAKYKNSGIGMIDTMRICHPRGDKQPAINELLSTGTIKIDENNTTWENLRSNGKSWIEILSTIKIGHMALLRNLRNIFSEINDNELCDKILKELVSGTEKGKQFPFRYYTAKSVIENSDVNFKAQILDALDECLDISTKNMPKLKGKTMCLSDNSGSAWGTFNSEYGSVTVADIANLSSVITARNADEGYVGTFGNELKVTPISKRNGILLQHEKVSNVGKTVGRATEGGIWEFFKNAIDKKEHWDNIFIYSDMQAGHGGLYGTSTQISEYRKYNCACRFNGYYVDIVKLIDIYRQQVNSKVNIYCVQVAGYDNVIVPESLYRTSILYGWSGKESIYADKINQIWDEIDNRQSQK